jgi:hypothetical protein
MWPSIGECLALRWRKVSIRVWALLVIAMITPCCVSAEQCMQMVFTGTVKAGEGYSHPLNARLDFRLAPLKDDWGWVISVGPAGSTEDWTAPVTFPIRTGEQQVVGTGYGSTVQDRLAGPVSVQFVLTEAEFERLSSMADETLDSPRPEAAGQFIEQVSKVSQGRATLQALKYGKGVTAETVKWMDFRITVLVPTSFPSEGKSWTPMSCPRQSPRRH